MPTDLLVVGLGNPGGEYVGTRHNVGVEVIDLLAERAGGKFRKSKDAPANVAEIMIGTQRIALAFPTTFMNESGRAVAPLCRRFDIDDLARLVIVHDELDLPVGRMKIKVGGGLAGNNGLRSVKAHLHSADFVRIRIGIGKPPGGSERGVDHVLKRPGKAERELISVCVHEAADAVAMIIADGVDAAMGRYNSQPDV